MLSITVDEKTKPVSKSPINLPKKSNLSMLLEGQTSPKPVDNFVRVSAFKFDPTNQFNSPPNSFTEHLIERMAIY